MKTRFIVVYGPPNSGKTLNREALKAHYRCNAVADEGEYSSLPYHLRHHGGRVLLLSQSPKVRNPSDRRKSLKGRAVKIEWAAKALGSRWIAPKPADAARKEIVPRHWTLGGTGVANFDLTHLEVYQEALRLHKDPSLVVCEHDMNGRPGLGSLHHLAGHDLGEFWVVFDLVRALFQLRRLFGVQHCGAAQWVEHRDERRRLEEENARLREDLKALTSAEQLPRTK